MQHLLPLCFGTVVLKLDRQAQGLKGVQQNPSKSTKWERQKANAMFSYAINKGAHGRNRTEKLVSKEVKQ